jgi:type III restriction enzyme
MKLHFEANLDYQLAAIESVCDLFRGQEICRTAFTVTRDFGGGQAVLAGLQDDLGIGNRLALSRDEILANLNDVQLRNGLKPSDSLASCDFTVEMETGTGKTYVYLRTIFELNRRFGFTKFVIVVPSVAIREGVFKTIQITGEHFQSLFANTPLEFFLYDSGKLGQVRRFATSPYIQIMVVTVGAINKKDVNNVYKDNEKTGGEKPIELIRATRPIVIVDEPQSVDGGLEGRGKEALGMMNPLCTLRYSATHVDKHYMVFRLGAVDAYERKLVKQVEVASAVVEGDHNKPYVRFLTAANQRGGISAKVELDIQRGNDVARVEKTVHDGDDLEIITGRAHYANWRIGEIRCGKGNELIEVKTPGDERWLQLGQAIGAAQDSILKRQMIRRTIQEHLDKELRLAPLGIKVLSLFFIDRVEHYRKYDESGKPRKGVYAEIFEDEYRRLALHPDYQSLFTGVDVQSNATQVHDGYFSQDKKGVWSNTAENNQGNRDNAERACRLIMKDKEKLLGFDTKLKFIFSHSALREGWDNPNIFQICALREIGTERERRQTIGRGLRLCVNQEGERLHGFDVNTLTIVATESYEQFADGLQKEIEQETGIRFDGAGKLVVKNADERRKTIETRQAVLNGEELSARWDQVKHRSTLRVKFDNETFIRACARAIAAAPAITATRLRWRKADVAIGKAGTHAQESSSSAPIVLAENDIELPDLLTNLEEKTQLTRRSLARILIDSKRLDDFKRNPQQFIDLAARAILDQLIDLRVGIGTAFDEPCESLLVR